MELFVINEAVESLLWEIKHTMFTCWTFVLYDGCIIMLEYLTPIRIKMFHNLIEVITPPLT